jgi:hypothetical protein
VPTLEGHARYVRVGPSTSFTRSMYRFRLLREALPGQIVVRSPASSASSSSPSCSGRARVRVRAREKVRVREWPVPPANESTQVALIQIFGTVAFTIVWQPAANVAKHSACAEMPANTRIVRAWPSGVAIDAFTTELPAPDAEFPQATGESSE